MSTQITIRLDDDAVAFIDRLVSEGHEKSRASVVSRALRREQRLEQAARDAEILASIAGTDPDGLDSLAAWSAAQPIDLD